MKGLEMMLSNMLGISPAEMKAMFEGVANAAENGVKALEEIKAQNALILDKLERLENGPGNESKGSD